MTGRKLRVYLSGRMSKNPNDRRWRKRLTPILERLNLHVFDPYVFQPSAPTIVKMRRIIQFDIRMVTRHTDLVVVLWDKGCRGGAGTHAELTYAFLNNIPVYCVKLAKMPKWARACCTRVFSGFTPLIGFLGRKYGCD